MSEYRAGVLRVSSCFPEQWVQRTLPPDHRIVAIKRGYCSSEQYLIEGPSLPIADPDGTPATVEIIQTMIALDDDRVKIVAHWGFMGVTSPCWVVGEWESTEAYRAERGC
jgi:hypothetical protein